MSKASLQALKSLQLIAVVRDSGETNVFALPQPASALLCVMRQVAVLVQLLVITYGLRLLVASADVRTHLVSKKAFWKNEALVRTHLLLGEVGERGDIPTDSDSAANRLFASTYRRIPVDQERPMRGRRGRRLQSSREECRWAVTLSEAVTSQCILVRLDGRCQRCCLL